jgi:hypothetical protein
MNLPDEIAKHVEKLPPAMQEQVLTYVASLASSRSEPVGENGSLLRQFASSLDPASAREMSQAIEEECERVDASQW